MKLSVLSYLFLIWCYNSSSTLLLFWLAPPFILPLPPMRKFLFIFIQFWLSVFHAQAQFFTVDIHHTHYKIKVIPPHTEKEAPLPSDTSLISLPQFHKVDSAATNTKEWTDRHISVSYPLQHIHVNSSFGYRSDPFTTKRSMHNGIDLRANYEPAYAMLDGIVERIGYDKRSGNYVTLRHGSYTVSYCHLSHILVSKGTSVKAGTPIAITGSTGRSTAPPSSPHSQVQTQACQSKVSFRLHWR